jgi:hypothetical protein
MAGVRSLREQISLFLEWPDDPVDAHQYVNFIDKRKL